MRGPALCLSFPMPSNWRKWETLAAAAATLPDPDDYFAGRLRPAEALPDSVLLFTRREAAQLRGATVSTSFHQRWVLVIPLRGRGVVLLDRSPHRLAPGRALLVPPLHLHAYAEVEPRPRWLFVTFEWPGQTALSADWRGPRALGAAALREVSALLASWRRPAGDGLDLAVTLHRLLRRLFPVGVVAAPVARVADPLLAAVRAAEKELPAGAALGVFARRLGMAESHLRARFRAVAGLSLGRYLREARLRRAATWLREERISVKDAAERAGFNDIYAFSRAFKRALGVPPSGLRGGARGVSAQGRG